jgi:16S rRNA (cytosine1402-N4)-methyltransferase
MGLLDVKPGDRCIDATIGDGGHARAILDAISPDGRLLGIDADPGSLERAGARLQSYGKMITLVNSNFSNLEDLVASHRFTPVMAILMDLGLASWQLEAGGRGFSFMENVPLDMRLGPDQAISASEIVNTLSASELTKIIATYGEEPRARRIASAIVRHRPIETAVELAKAIEEAVPRRGRRIHPATRTFQAVRIVINRELQNLESALEQAVRMLSKGGRLAVIAYHSLEDRIIKNFMRRESRDCICPPEQFQCICGHTASVKVITKKVIKASRAEVTDNPRVRSTRLRACIALSESGT